MPSSHMTVMAGFTYWIIESCRNNKNKNLLGLKIFLLISCVVQGIARYVLNYHTVPQIVAGIVFGVFSVLILFKLIDIIYFKNKNLILKYLPIVDDSKQQSK
jgi:membrane-associated phospholipid phosphatase